MLLKMLSCLILFLQVILIHYFHVKIPQPIVNAIFFFLSRTRNSKILRISSRHERRGIRVHINSTAQIYKARVINRTNNLENCVKFFTRSEIISSTELSETKSLSKLISKKKFQVDHLIVLSIIMFLQFSTYWMSLQLARAKLCKLKLYMNYQRNISYTDWHLVNLNIIWKDPEKWKKKMLHVKRNWKYLWQEIIPSKKRKFLGVLVIWLGWVLWHNNYSRLFNAKSCLSYLPTPPLGQDMTQGQF